MRHALLALGLLVVGCAHAHDEQADADAYTRRVFGTANASTSEPSAQQEPDAAQQSSERDSRIEALPAMCHELEPGQQPKGVNVLVAADCPGVRWGCPMSIGTERDRQLAVEQKCAKRRSPVEPSTDESDPWTH